MAGTLADRSIGANELRFAAGEEHRLGEDRPLVKPRRRSLGAHDRNTVAILDEFPEP
jgi:hypothetical protein